MKTSTIISYALLAATSLVRAADPVVDLHPRQYGYGPGYGDTTTKAAATATGSAAASESTEYGGGYGSSSGEGSEYGALKISPYSAVLAHATCGALATMLFLPSGVLAARVIRGVSPSRSWFMIHAGVQGIVGLGLITAGASIGWARFTLKTIDTQHRKAAVSLFVIVWVQALLGAVTHAVGAKRLQRGPLNFVHWTLGLATVGLGWAVAWLGFTSEWTYRGHGEVSHKWRIGWGVVIALWILAYAAGLSLLPRQLKREAATNEVARVARLDSETEAKDTREEREPFSVS